MLDEAQDKNREGDIENIHTDIRLSAKGHLPIEHLHIDFKIFLAF